MPKRNRPYVALRSTEDRETVYMTQKNPKNTPDRLVLNKFSKRLGKVVEFKESR